MKNKWDSTIKQGKKYGFINKKGIPITGYKFDKARDFSEGLAGVSYKLRWGFIDKKGNWVTKNKYLDVMDFKKGLALVKYDYDKWGYIDAYGNEYWED